MCAGVFLAAIDQTVVVTVLPRIIDDLEGGFSPTGVERAGWIITAYLFGFAVVLPLMGRVADLYGHRRTYGLAMVIFALGSLLCAVSDSLYALVGFRTLQAIGGGAVVPISMAVVGHNFPVGKRALALGIIGAAGEAGGVLGPLYGSFVGQYIGWRAIFYLNIPLVIVILWLLWRFVSESKRYQVAIDYRSAALMALGLGLTTLGVSAGREAGWYDFGLPLMGLGLALIVAFVFSDLRSKHPLVNFQLFANRSFASANVAHFLVGIALITALVQVPSFAYSSGWPASSYSDPMTGGLLLIRLTLMIPAGAIIGGLLCGRLGGRFPAVTGLALSAFGLWQMSLWGVDVGALRQTMDLLIAGFGFGLVIAPISLAVVNSVRRRRMASASAVLTTSRIIGMMVGLAALNSWGINKFQRTQEADPAPVPRLGISIGEYLEELKLWEHRSVEAILGVLSDFFLIAAVICVIAIVPSLLLFRKSREPYGNGE
ncbi:MAG: MFS transporter [Thermoleophilia bacterium]